MKLKEVKVIVFDFNRTLFDPDSSKLIEGALIVLDFFFKKFDLVLYSKKGEGRESLIFDLGLNKFFKKIISVESKSADDLIQLTNEWNLKPENFLIIGDRIKSEITAGKKAGFKTVWFKQGKFAFEEPSSPEEFPDFILSDLRNLINLFD
ncbi:MAG TPA: HAD hydrolase-like protein [archaeon]|nr:HAD hydrolase-like protein [archaeon]